MRKTKKKVNINEIEQDIRYLFSNCEKYYGVSIEDMRKKIHTTELNVMRNACYYVMKAKMFLTFSQISHIFNRSIREIQYRIAKTIHLMYRDREFYEIVKKIYPKRSSVLKK